MCMLTSEYVCAHVCMSIHVWCRFRSHPITYCVQVTPYCRKRVIEISKITIVNDFLMQRMWYSKSKC